jgi:hypothetical protein
MQLDLRPLLLIALLFTCVFATCKKDKDCVKASYNFEVGVKALPDVDSINIGDTIRLEVKEPVNLRDLTSGNFIDFSGAKNFSSVMAIGELQGNGVERFAINDFAYLLTEGSEVPSINVSRFKEFYFTERNGYYLFRLAVIPKKTGIYRIGFSDAANVFTNRNPCAKSAFGINFKDTDQHLYYNQWNFGVMPTLPNGVYCFKVK